MRKGGVLCESFMLSFVIINHIFFMKKFIRITCKVLLSLIMLMPIVGAFGVFPAPTADFYTNPKAFAFIEALMGSGYINPIMAIVFALALAVLWTKREALAAILILPITVNIVAFHLFLDGGLLTPGAIMGNALFVLNVYFLWQHRAAYASLMKQK